MTLTIAFNHTVTVIAHIAKELDNREITSFDVYRAMRGNYFFFFLHFTNIMMRVMLTKAINLLGSFFLTWL